MGVLPAWCQPRLQTFGPVVEPASSTGVVRETAPIVDSGPGQAVFLPDGKILTLNFRGPSLFR